MRCNWQRWLWGLIPLLMVSWAAIQVERDRVQQDLTDRTKAVLSASGLPWASVEVSGRDVLLRGSAFRDSEPPQAERALRKVWGVRDVENRAILPPKISPFIWSARRRGNRIRLGGYVSDRSTRQAVIGLSKAAMPGLEVLDRMHMGRGVPAPDTWLAGLSFALKQLSLLKQGEARFDDLALTISGEAEDPAAFKAVATALKSGLPNGITLVSSQIAAPVISPFTWSAQFAGGQLVLAGHVAGGETTRADLLAAAKTAAPTLNTVDRMDSAEGAPKGWTDVAITLMRELVRLENGTVEMEDAALTVGGVAADEQQAQAIRSALRASIPQAFALVDQIRVREVKAPEPPPAPPPPPVEESRSPPPSQAETSQTAAAFDPASKPPVESAPIQAAPAPEPRIEAPSKETAEPQRAETPAAKSEPSSQASQPERESRHSGQVHAPSDPAPKKQAAAEPQAPESRSEPKQTAPAPPVSEPPSTQRAAAPPPASQSEPTQTATAPEPSEAPQKKHEAAEPPPAVVAAAPPPRPEAEPPTAATVMPVAPPPKEVGVCQQSLDRITRAGHINFASDSAALDSSSFETLSRLAAAAKACPQVRIAIEGHTDAEGTMEYNQRLSVRRAKAVETYLVKAGADRRQLEAVGYGPTRPAAPNDSEENMAKNRRIEFSVRQK